ncbi:MAG: TonB family protein [Blastocatellia bacterium]|nr:TonB family protein [Blastocatellia bacterium]
MRFICKGIFCILLVSSCVTAQSDGRSLFERVQPSVVTVISYDETGKVIRQGIGLIVSKEGDCIVHKLLVEGVSRAEVRTSEGQTYAVIKVVARDSLSDMALVSVAMPKEAASPAKVSKAVPKAGDTVAVAILDESSRQRLIEGTVSNIKRYAVWENVEVAVPLPARSLGNPVFNAKGEFIGMVSFQSEGNRNFTAVAGNRLPNMIEEMLKSRSGKRPKSSDKAAGPLSDEEVQRIASGVLRGSAKKRVQPSYPSQAKAYRITGTVVVEVLVDEEGNVIRAKTIRGNYQRPADVTEGEARSVIPFLEKASEGAALKWKFKPTTISGVPVRVIGTITFRFSM